MGLVLVGVESIMRSIQLAERSASFEDSGMP